MAWSSGRSNPLLGGREIVEFVEFVAPQGRIVVLEQTNRGTYAMIFTEERKKKKGTLCVSILSSDGWMERMNASALLQRLEFIASKSSPSWRAMKAACVALPFRPLAVLGHTLISLEKRENNSQALAFGAKLICVYSAVQCDSARAAAIAIQWLYTPFFLPETQRLKELWIGCKCLVWAFGILVQWEPLTARFAIPLGSTGANTVRCEYSLHGAKEWYNDAL
ncbi:hypothetical protein SELMODRAFT_423881 [Selaginella moellendorffii]|uniref:Uncharacterized protein n=1 Tax=Selaginella moellendorffii TaxID=88036 RepID=D8SN38_SELML|nr:hypothetical protein SELMODRAFT_423881 [Selaginella moellendorffii]